MLQFHAINEDEQIGPDVAIDAPQKELQEALVVKDYENALRLQFSHKLAEAKAVFLRILASDLWENTNLSQNVLTVKYSTYKNLATIEEQEGAKMQALINLLKAVELDASEVLVWNRIGGFALGLGSLGIARKAFERGIACSPRNLICIEKLLDVLFILDDIPSCLDVIEYALAVDQWNSKALLLKAYIGEQSGELSRAEIQRLKSAAKLPKAIEVLLKRKSDHLKHEGDEAARKSNLLEEEKRMPEAAVLRLKEGEILQVRSASWSSLAFVLKESLKQREQGVTPWQLRVRIEYKEPTPPPPPPPPASVEDQCAEPNTSVAEETLPPPTVNVTEASSLGSALAALFNAPGSEGAAPVPMDTQSTAKPDVIDLTDKPSLAPASSVPAAPVENAAPDTSVATEAPKEAPASPTARPAPPKLSLPPAIPENVLELLGASENPELFSPLNPNVRIVSRVRPPKPGEATPSLISPDRLRRKARFDATTEERRRSSFFDQYLLPSGSSPAVSRFVLEDYSRQTGDEELSLLPPDAAADDSILRVSESQTMFAPSQRRRPTKRSQQQQQQLLQQQLIEEKNAVVQWVAKSEGEWTQLCDQLLDSLFSIPAPSKEEKDKPPAVIWTSDLVESVIQLHSALWQHTSTLRKYTISVAELLFELSKRSGDRNASQCDLLMKDIMQADPKTSAAIGISEPACLVRLYWLKGRHESAYGDPDLALSYYLSVKDTLERAASSPSSSALQIPIELHHCSRDRVISVQSVEARIKELSHQSLFQLANSLLKSESYDEIIEHFKPVLFPEESSFSSLLSSPYPEGARQSSLTPKVRAQLNDILLKAAMAKRDICTAARCLHRIVEETTMDSKLTNLLPTVTSLQAFCTIVEEVAVAEPTTNFNAATLEAIARLESSMSVLYAMNTENKSVAVQLVLYFLLLLQTAHGTGVSTISSSSSASSLSAAEKNNERVLEFLERAHDDLGKRDACHEMNGAFLRAATLVCKSIIDSTVILRPLLLLIQGLIIQRTEKDRGSKRKEKPEKSKRNANADNNNDEDDEIEILHQPKKKGNDDESDGADESDGEKKNKNDQEDEEEDEDDDEEEDATDLRRVAQRTLAQLFLCRYHLKFMDKGLVNHHTPEFELQTREVMQEWLDDVHEMLMSFIHRPKAAKSANLKKFLERIRAEFKELPPEVLSRRQQVAAYLRGDPNSSLPQPTTVETLFDGSRLPKDLFFFLAHFTDSESVATTEDFYHLDLAIGSNTSRYESWAALGEIYRRRFEDYLEAQPNVRDISSQIWKHVSVAYRKAYCCLRKAIEIRDESAVVRRDLGLLMYLQAKYCPSDSMSTDAREQLFADALNEFRAGRAIDSADWDCSFMMAKTMMKLQQDEKRILELLREVDFVNSGRSELEPAYQLHSYRLKMLLKHSSDSEWVEYLLQSQPTDVSIPEKKKDSTEENTAEASSSYSAKERIILGIVKKMQSIRNADKTFHKANYKLAQIYSMPEYPGGRNIAEAKKSISQLFNPSKLAQFFNIWKPTKKFKDHFEVCQRAGKYPTRLVRSAQLYEQLLFENRDSQLLLNLTNKTESNPGMKGVHEKAKSDWARLVDQQLDESITKIQSNPDERTNPNTSSSTLPPLLPLPPSLAASSESDAAKNGSSADVQIVEKPPVTPASSSAAAASTLKPEDQLLKSIFDYYLDHKKADTELLVPLLRKGLAVSSQSLEPLKLTNEQVLAQLQQKFPKARRVGRPRSSGAAAASASPAHSASSSVSDLSVSASASVAGTEEPVDAHENSRKRKAAIDELHDLLEGALHPQTKPAKEPKKNKNTTLTNDSANASPSLPEKRPRKKTEKMAEAEQLANQTKDKEKLEKKQKKKKKKEKNAQEGSKDQPNPNAPITKEKKEQRPPIPVPSTFDTPAELMAIIRQQARDGWKPPPPAAP